MSKLMRPIDYRSTAGMMLRGKTRYGGSGTSPNPAGINTKRAAKTMLKMRKNAHS